MNLNILFQYIEGKVGQETKEKVAQWLDSDKKNMLEFILLRGIYDATIWNEPERRTLFTQAKSNKLLREFTKIAAVFVIAFCCSCFFILKQNTKGITESKIVMQTIYTPAGQRAEITLSDGTKVWLNAMTSLSFPSQFTEEERRIELNGEAYFDVKEDQFRQFVVCSGDYQIRVLGTEFNVKAYQQNNVFETALVEGSLEVESNQTKEKVTLIPGSYVCNNEGILSIGKFINKDQFLWKEGIIAFEEVTVRDIFNKLELYFDVIIEVKNFEILDFHYTGKFRMKEGVEHVLRVLQLRHKFTYTIDYESNKIVIR